MKGLILSSLSLLVTTSSMVETELCKFLPKNDRYIPAFTKEGEEPTGITKEQFNSILDRVHKIYAPIVEARGGKLDIQRLWDDGTVNASAERLGITYRLNMYGGLARHPITTPDGFMLVVCHEMGHHVGGKPKYSQWWPIGSDSWASVEGQSDYFGVAKCMRRMYLDMSDEEFNNFPNVNQFAKDKCAEVYEDLKDIAMCVRNAEAGIVLGNLLADLGGSPAVDLQTPSAEVYSGIMQSHPKAQCRADTYFQGALCDVAYDVDFSDTDNTTGACNAADHSVGLRPKCWFNPKKKAPRGQKATVHKEEVYY